MKGFTPPALRRALRGGAYHWREYRIEEYLPSADLGRKVLLLGCGDGRERPFLWDRGFHTIGLDIRSNAADIRADAHRLPFCDATFDIVLSMQVLEHLHSPWVAVDEIARVLRPDGWLIGSVAFLKPYHNSYFHMTHKGLQRLLEACGLESDRFEGAQSLTDELYGEMLPFPGLRWRRALLGTFDGVLRWVRALVWSWTRRADPDRPSHRFDEGFSFSFRTFDRLRYAPAIVFRAQKKSRARGELPDGVRELDARVSRFGNGPRAPASLEARSAPR